MSSLPWRIILFHTHIMYIHNSCSSTVFNKILINRTDLLGGDLILIICEKCIILNYIVLKIHVFRQPSNHINLPLG
jgi:hypothetical protein